MIESAKRIVSYGSINLVGYGRSEETMMCLKSTGIACGVEPARVDLAASSTHTSAIV